MYHHVSRGPFYHFKESFRRASLCSALCTISWVVLIPVICLSRQIKHIGGRPISHIPYTFP